MRHRATSAVRVFDRCARCGTQYLRAYDVRKVTVTLAGRRHELVVCRDCDECQAAIATPMESAAMGIVLTNPIECMEFMQRYGADPERVRRTAEHFLGAELFAVEMARAQEEIAPRRAVREQRDEERLARVAAEYEKPVASPWADFNDDEGTGDPPDDD